MATGMVEITIADGGAGAVFVPQAQLQIVMGCAGSGSTAAIVATRQPSTLIDTYGYSPLAEAAGLMLAQGGTALCLRIPTTTAGAVAKKAAKSVTDATNASPIVVTTSAAHGLVTGDVVVIASVGGNTAANGTFVVTKIDGTSFSLNGSTGNGAYTSGGTVTPQGVIMSGTGMGYMLFSGTALDDYQIEVTPYNGFTAGVAGGQITVSIDGGRQQVLPRVSLGTSTSYVIPQTGITVTLSGVFVAGDKARGYTTAPRFAVADISEALAILADSPYAVSGWGSMHLVGAIIGSDATTIGGEMDSVLAAAKLYSGLMGSVRDASPPAAWGGTGETDATWSAAVLADFSAVSQKRIGVSAGHYNVRSVFRNPICGQPILRRPLSFPWAARVVALPRRADLEAWVRLGALPNVILDPVNDPIDGWVYHDDFTAPAFNNLASAPGRMTGALKRKGADTGWYIANGLTLAAQGSDFQLFARRRTMDDVATIVNQVMTPFIAQRIKRNANGTIRESEALSIEAAQHAAIDNAIGDQISGRSIVVDRDYNIAANNKIHITGTIEGDAYALEIDETIGFGSV